MFIIVSLILLIIVIMTNFCSSWDLKIALHRLFSKYIFDAFNIRSGLGSTPPPADDTCQLSDGGEGPSQT